MWWTVYLLGGRSACLVDCHLLGWQCHQLLYIHYLLYDSGTGSPMHVLATISYTRIQECSSLGENHPCKFHGHLMLSWINFKESEMRAALAKYANSRSRCVMFNHLPAMYAQVSEWLECFAGFQQCAMYSAIVINNVLWFLREGEVDCGDDGVSPSLKVIVDIILLQMMTLPKMSCSNQNDHKQCRRRHHMEIYTN